MAEIRYVMAAPIGDDYAWRMVRGYPIRQLTMLASGDFYADVEVLTAEARRIGWKGALRIARWISEASGAEQHEDGRDKFREHVRENQSIIVEGEDL